MDAFQRRVQLRARLKVRKLKINDSSAQHSTSQQAPIKRRVGERI